MQGLSNYPESGGKIYLEKMAIWNKYVSESLDEAISNLTEMNSLQESFWYHFRSCRRILFQRLQTFFRRMFL
jgi:hypothetical protein